MTRSNVSHSSHVLGNVTRMTSTYSIGVNAAYFSHLVTDYSRAHAYITSLEEPPAHEAHT